MKPFSSLPWDQSTLLGYFAESCFEITTGMTYYIINGVMILLYISICIHYQAFYDMIKHSTDKWTLSNDNYKNNEQFLRNLIRFHISAKEWVQNDRANMLREILHFKF